MFDQGDYVCMVKTQGGGAVAAILDEESISWQRRLNEVSSASAVARPQTSIDAWSHELSIYRNETEIWVGPIQQPDWEAVKMTLAANDVMQWFERRRIPIDISWENVDAAEIFAEVVNLAMAQDPTPNISLGVSDTGVLAERVIREVDRVRAADVLRELSRTAIDYTAIGRRVLAGGREIPGLTPFTLVDGDLLNPKVTSKGSDAVTEASVVGTAPVVADAGGAAEAYGLIQQTYSEADIKDFGSAGAAASARILHGNPPPVYVTGTLATGAECGIDLLIPGTHVFVHLDEVGRPVHQEMRLAQVDGKVQGGQESVEVTMIPLGEDA